MLGLVIFTTGSFIGGLGTGAGQVIVGRVVTGHRRRLRHAGHVVAAHHHLPAPRAAQGHRPVGRLRRRRRRPRPHRDRRPAGELLVGVGLPRQHPHRRPRAAGGGRLLAHVEGPGGHARSTRSAPSCPWSAWAPCVYGIIEGPEKGWTQRRACWRLRRWPPSAWSASWPGNGAIDPPHAAPAPVQGPAHERGQRGGHRRLLHHVRPVLPVHPLPAVRPGLLAAERGPVHPAPGRGPDRHRPPQRDPGREAGYGHGDGVRVRAHRRRLRRARLRRPRPPPTWCWRCRWSCWGRA